MRSAIKLVILLVLVTGGVAAAGAGVWYLALGRQAAPSFKTVTAEKGDLLATISATGTIEPEEVIDVGAQVAAQIKNFGPDPRDSSKTIDYGSPVHKDTLLAQLDDAPFKARVEEAQAAVDVAQTQIDAADANIKRAEADLIQMKAKVYQTQRDWVRAQKLLKSQSLADVDYDTARAAYETATSGLGVDEAAILQAKAAKAQAEKTKAQSEASLQEAKVNLGYTQIRSPVEGVIVDRRVNVGQTVVAGLNAPSLFLIAKDLKRLQVWASVNEADIGNIHPGQNVKFTVDAYPHDTFAGQVAQIRLNASNVQNVVTYTVVVSTDNSDGRLLPYLSANLQFEIAHQKDVLEVPNAALRWKPQPAEIAPDARAAFAKGGRRQGASPPGQDGGEKPRGTPDKAKDSRDHAVVWVQDGPYVRPVRVKIGLSDGAMTEITGGDLQPGQQVVAGEKHADADLGAGGTPFTPKLFGGNQKKPQ